MSTVNDAIDKARADAQDLHQKVMAATSKDKAAISADFNQVAASAQQLSASLKQSAQAQEPDTKRYLNDAASRMQDAASHAKEAAQATASEFSQAKSKVVADVTTGVKSISYAVAAKRAAQEPARA